MQCQCAGRDGFERVGVTPAIRVHDVVGDRLAQESGLRPALHGPGVPLEMEPRQIEQARGAEGEAAELCAGRARTSMVPRPDDEVMTRASFRRCMLHVLAVVREGARLVVIVTAGN